MACCKFLMNFNSFSWIPRIVSFLDLSSLECLCFLSFKASVQVFPPWAAKAFSDFPVLWNFIAYTVSIDVPQRFYVEGAFCLLNWHINSSKIRIMYSIPLCSQSWTECPPHSRYSVIVDAVSNHQIIWQSYYSINYQITQ